MYNKNKRTVHNMNSCEFNCYWRKTTYRKYHFYRFQSQKWVNTLLLCLLLFNKFTSLQKLIQIIERTRQVSNFLPPGCVWSLEIANTCLYDLYRRKGIFCGCAVAGNLWSVCAVSDVFVVKFTWINITSMVLCTFFNV